MSTQRGLKGIDEFATLVVRSELISPDRLGELIGDFRKTEEAIAYAELAAFVKFLTDRGILTNWHCQKLREGKFKGFFLDQYKLLEHLHDDDKYNYYLAMDTASRKRVVLRIHQPKGWWPKSIAYDVDEALNE